MAQKTYKISEFETGGPCSKRLESLIWTLQNGFQKEEDATILFKKEEILVEEILEHPDIIFTEPLFFERTIKAFLHGTKHENLGLVFKTVDSLQRIVWSFRSLKSIPTSRSKKEAKLALAENIFNRKNQLLAKEDEETVWELFLETTRLMIYLAEGPDGDLNGSLYGYPNKSPDGKNPDEKIWEAYYGILNTAIIQIKYSLLGGTFE